MACPLFEGKPFGLKKDPLISYLSLRKAIMESERHPDDEFYELSEMHANDVYYDALEALILARMEK